MAQTTSTSTLFKLEIYEENWNLKLEFYESFMSKQLNSSDDEALWYPSQIPSSNQLPLGWTDQEWNSKSIRHGTKRNLVWKGTGWIVQDCSSTPVALLSYTSCILISSLSLSGWCLRAVAEYLWPHLSIVQESVTCVYSYTGGVWLQSSIVHT